MGFFGLVCDDWSNVVNHQTTTRTFSQTSLGLVAFSDYFRPPEFPTKTIDTICILVYA